MESGDLNVAQASPILIDGDGETQLVVFGGLGVSGFDPRDGRLLWSHPHDTHYDMNMGTPIWDPDDNMLFITSAYDNGSRMLHLSPTEGITRVEERWHTRLMRVQFTSSIRMGDFIVGSSGDFCPTFLTAVDVESGAGTGAGHAYRPGGAGAEPGTRQLVLDDPNAGGAYSTRAFQNTYLSESCISRADRAISNLRVIPVIGPPWPFAPAEADQVRSLICDASLNRRNPGTRLSPPSTPERVKNFRHSPLTTTSASATPSRAGCLLAHC